MRYSAISTTAGPLPTEGQSVELLDGRSVLIRPVRPSDAPRLIAFHGRLSPTSIHNRFFGSHPHLTPAEAQQFAVVDGRRRFALVAVGEDRLLGVGRFEAITEVSAEIAFVVADDYQGHGLGTALLRLLGRRAADEGYARLIAKVLASNAQMLGVFAHSGMQVEFRRTDTVVEVTVTIGKRSPHRKEERVSEANQTRTVLLPGDLGRRITYWRELRGLTRSELARRAGVDEGYLEYLETRPMSAPAHKTVTRIATAVGTTATELLGGNVDRASGHSPAAGSPRLVRLTTEECWARLGSSGIGRLVFDTESGPIALPINFVVRLEHVLLRTATGSSIDQIPQDVPVSLEADHIDDAMSSGWSVLLRGTCEHFDSACDVPVVFDLEIDPWAGGKRERWMRVRPGDISGREIDVLR